MNPYVISWQCALCGGEGVAHARDAAALWYGDAYHKDPRVCRDELARKAAVSRGAQEKAEAK